MTYDAFETSTEAGDPVEVYEVVAGTTTYYFTSADSVQTIGAQDYTPVGGLQRGDRQEGPDRRERDFTLELPTANELAQLFVGVLPGFRVRLTVKRFHASDTPTPEVVQVFDGYVQSASFGKAGGKVCTLTARTTIASLGRVLPRRTFASSCVHVLYDSSTCKVDDTDPTFRASTLSVASQVGGVLTVSSGLSGTYADDYMQGGFVEVIGGADFRLIIGHTGNVLTLQQPFATEPSSVNVYAGCAHMISVCSSKFDNVVNYGGFAFVPTRNPFEGID